MGKWMKTAAALLAAVGLAAPSAAATPEEEMGQLLSDMKTYAEARHPGFLFLGNGAAGLFAVTEKNPAANVDTVSKALDGVMAESVFYGGGMKVDEMTAPADTAAYETLLAEAEKRNLTVFSLDYCADPAKRKDALAKAKRAGYVEALSPAFGLDTLLPPTGVKGKGNARTLAEVRTFQILLNPMRYTEKAAYLAALSTVPEDLLIIDRDFGGAPLTAEDVETIRTGAKGKRKLVLAYMSVGEANDFRSYWKPEWTDHPPAWLGAENPNWKGAYRVEYWTPEWRRVLYGTPDSYLDTILAAGFDGVFLDVINAYAYF